MEEVIGSLEALWRLGGIKYFPIDGEGDAKSSPCLWIGVDCEDKDMYCSNIALIHLHM